VGSSWPSLPSSWGEVFGAAVVNARQTRLTYGGGLDILQGHLKSGELTEEDGGAMRVGKPLGPGIRDMTRGSGPFVTMDPGMRTR
jgi:hypothetical protein